MNDYGRNMKKWEEKTKKYKQLNSWLERTFLPIRWLLIFFL